MNNNSTSSVRATNKFTLSHAEGLIPELRFPEFVNEGEWVGKTIDKAYSFLVTNSFSRENLNYEEGSVKNIHYGDIHTKFSTLFDITKECVPFINSDITIERIREECYCKEGDLIFADASEDLNDVGKSMEIINLNNEKLVSGLHTLLARQKKSKLIIGFAGFLFKTDWVRKQIQREAQGAKVLGISANRISNVKISYPDKTEQQKIASCLSSLDEVIAAHSQKLDALKEHKKGLMQNLFPNCLNYDSNDEMISMISGNKKNHSQSQNQKNQSSDNVPNFRFPEFVEDGEWVEKTLIDLALNGFSNGVFNDPKKVGYGYKLINVTDMYIETTINETKLSLVGISELEFVRNKVEFGDIFFTRSSLVASGIAKSNIYLGKSSDITFDGHLIRLRPKIKLVVPMFLYFLLQTNYIRSQMVAKGKTATMTTIGQSDIASVNLQLPSNPKEQQKIASCLSSSDALITAQAEKIEQLKLHKKGLMQGLFPKNV